ncbi:hypothetical protein LAZ67_6004039 [Cordylochernes scorpioides]|uniref:Mos1 transposase HTH domain-containing protein n=1 Tax=Cordylochernes scorpioides TaxID=51811 RepID=A0ABY6KLR9_9ARAC|nr:hypothetical protein LAZ67_6004039 [Cordylochernes scorpioides]
MTMHVHMYHIKQPPYSKDSARKSSTILLTARTLPPVTTTCFPLSKKHLAGQKLESDEEVQEAVISWLRDAAGEWYNTDIKKTGFQDAKTYGDETISKHQVHFWYNRFGRQSIEDDPRSLNFNDGAQHPAERVYLEEEGGQPEVGSEVERGQHQGPDYIQLRYGQHLTLPHIHLLSQSTSLVLSTVLWHLAGPAKNLGQDGLQCLEGGLEEEAHHPILSFLHTTGTDSTMAQSEVLAEVGQAETCVESHAVQDLVQQFILVV